LFGGTVGFNVQNWGLVFGVEGDLAGNWMRNNTSSGTGICAVPGCTVQTSWFGTARGRVGYAFDRALFYVTAGGAFGDVQMTAGGPTATVERAGWTAGAGLEYGILGPWSAKIEYLYADLGNATCGAASCGVDTSVSFKTSIVRFGVNYRFW
ncbi:MAG TPA: outer membrane beta-barrel protein, partial [Pseudolabrys sp.]|nr:outer membrane beta-barrel protein [Pseudolabrys sp.]